MANAFLTMHMLGMDDVKSFGDSTGELSLDAGVARDGRVTSGRSDLIVDECDRRIRSA